MSAEEQKDSEEIKKDKIIKEIQRKADEEFFLKRVNGGMYSYNNINQKKINLKKEMPLLIC